MLPRRVWYRMVLPYDKGDVVFRIEYDDATEMVYRYNQYGNPIGLDTGLDAYRCERDSFANWQHRHEGTLWTQDASRSLFGDALADVGL